MNVTGLKCADLVDAMGASTATAEEVLAEARNVEAADAASREAFAREPLRHPKHAS